MSLMEQFANPETIHSLSFGDKMAGTGITALMGMGTTFAILFLLWSIIAILSKIINRADAAMAGNAPAKAETREAAATPAPAPVSKMASEGSGGGTAEGTAEKPVDGDPELIAVIMAAIAAQEGPAVTVSNLNIRRIQRVAGQSPAWARAGRSEVIDSRRM